MNLYKVEKKDIKRTGYLLAEAFKNDPVWSAIFKESDFSKMHYFFEGPARFGLKYGQVFSPSNKLEGVMVWAHSKDADMTIWKGIRCGSFMSGFKVGFKIMSQMMPMFMPLEDDRKENMKGREYIYLMVIGIDPKYQGQGYGGNMLKTLLSEADSKKLPIYLETSTDRNIKMYEKLGFKILKKMTHPIINIPQWEMLKEPQ